MHSEIILLSDGFTQAATRLSHATDMSILEIEQKLTEEFDPLLKLCTAQCIGESVGNLEKTMAYIVSSDVIIHGNSCFPLALLQAYSPSNACKLINIEDSI